MKPRPKFMDPVRTMTSAANQELMDSGKVAQVRHHTDGYLAARTEYRKNDLSGAAPPPSPRRAQITSRGTVFRNFDWGRGSPPPVSNPNKVHRGWSVDRGVQTGSESQDKSLLYSTAAYNRGNRRETGSQTVKQMRVKRRKGGR